MLMNEKHFRKCENDLISEADGTPVRGCVLLYLAQNTICRSFLHPFPHPMHCLSLAEDCLVHLLTKTGKVVLHPSTVFKKLFSNDTNSTLKWINAICCQLQRLQSYGRKDICLLFSILKIKCTHAVTFFSVDLWILFPGWNWRTEFFNINASTGKHNEKGLLHNGDKLGCSLLHCLPHPSTKQL